MNPKSRLALEIVFLLIITAVVYLPNVGNLSYFKDDWYYIYDGTIAGADVFRSMFSIDRPARGVFFEIYYSLFNYHALPYHLGAYVWRLLGAIGALWLFRLLWPKDRQATFFTALLFALFPGYFWWISAVEYQPMIASLALQVFSIALTLKAIQATQRPSRILYILGAVLTGWAYIALVDYAIGMEAFRFLCVYMLVSREQRVSTLWSRLRVTLRTWLVNLIIPAGFILWRMFFFENERRATDIGSQLRALFSAPVPTASRWFIQFFNSLMNVGLLAWVAQFPRYFFEMRLRDTALALLDAGCVLFLVTLAGKLLEEPVEAEFVHDSHSSAKFQREAFMIGLAGMTFGVLPVIAANRYVNLEGFSHYALPASLAAAVFIMGLVYAFSSARVRFTAVVVLCVFAALAHYSISVRAVGEEAAIREFWWQASWRIPGLRPETTLAIQYPDPNIGDDGLGVMEAANLIYFPDGPDTIPVHYPISAVAANDENAKLILRGRLNRDTAYRSHTVNFDFGNVLVLSQPTPASCVRVIDGQRHLLSAFDPGNIFLIAPHSKIENVVTGAIPSTPPEFAFGLEPPHEWCYYFEKADLAVQQFGWREAAALGEEAIGLGLHPEDQAEWFPFLQAYAVLDDESRVRMTATKINTQPFLRDQTCSAFNQGNAALRLDPSMQTLINELFCH
jgi:hypothetical protein